jgi:hypothetical protein
MDVEIGTAAAQFLFSKYINGVFVAVYRGKVLYYKYSLLRSHLSSFLVLGRLVRFSGPFLHAKKCINN